MSTNGPGISADAGTTVGGDTGELADRLKDVAPSSSDPHDDLVMAHLPTPAWNVLLDKKQEGPKVLSVLQGLTAWKAAGRLRRAHGLPVWPGENAAENVVLPTTFQLARQSGADASETQDRINYLEALALELLGSNLELATEVLQARDVRLWKDTRMDVLKTTLAIRDTAGRKALLGENQFAVPRDAHPHGYLENARRTTKDMIEASAKWALHLARHFDGKFRNLSKDSVFDVSQSWWKPQDQGRTAGCVGWAVADLLRLQRYDSKFFPSARYLWHGAKELDGESRPTTFVARAGTSVRGALQLVKEVGCALESELPSDSQELFPGTLDQFYRDVSERKVAAVVNLGMDKKMWLSWIALERPVVCALRINNEFVQLNAANPRLENFDPHDPSLINHAVVIAGWRLAPETFEKSSSYDLVAGANTADTKKPEDDNKVSFPVEYLVRNSFGDQWGKGGYAWVPHRLMRLMAREAYGVLISDAEVDDPGKAPREPSWAGRAAREGAART
jgi:hypothetical protein